MLKNQSSGVATRRNHLRLNSLVPRALLATLAIFLLLMQLPVLAMADPGEQLQQAVDEILQILQSEELRRPDKDDEREQRILAVVNDMFDFREMARSSLGPSWNDITPAEQDEFVGLFASLVKQRYIGKVDSYDNQKVVYTKELVRGDRAMIYTAIVDKELEIPIVYRMQKQNGKWLVNDLKIENVSLVANYRRDFDSITRKEGFGGLVKKIREQLEKTGKAN